MAASITHMVVGQRVFKHLTQFNPSLTAYRSFLAGCVIVDVHAFQDLDRRVTHFIGRMDVDGEDAYRKSCANFLNGLDGILKTQWAALSQTEQAFVSGYLCHLAVDECWKELGWLWYQKLNITSWKDFPVHPDVMLTAFDFLSRKALTDQADTFAALDAVRIPDIFCHVPYEMLCRHWEIIRAYLISDGTFESYASMLKKANRFDEKTQVETAQRFRSWEKALELIESVGGVSSFIVDAAAHSVKTIHTLEQNYSTSRI